jgi:hypothetical protein
MFCWAHCTDTFELCLILCFSLSFPLFPRLLGSLACWPAGRRWLTLRDGRQQHSRRVAFLGYRSPWRYRSLFRSVHNSQAAFEPPLARVGRGVGQTLGGPRSAPAAICIALHQPCQKRPFWKG